MKDLFRKFLTEPGSRKAYVFFLSIVLFAAILPLLLHLAGIDIAGYVYRVPEIPAWRETSAGEELFLTKSLFFHTLLEWTSVLIAVFVAIISFFHFRLTNNVTIPVIGSALFTAGLLDAFHLFVTDHIVAVNADYSSMVEFTWFISRLFNPLIMIAGISLLLLRKKYLRKNESGFRFLLLTFVVFLATGIAVVMASLYLERPPVLRFSLLPSHNQNEFIPLFLFLLAGLFLYPVFSREFPGIFSRAILIGVLPESITQVFMLYSGDTNTDLFYYLAHGSKIIAYSVPLFGLMLDYMIVYNSRETEVRSLQKMESALKQSSMRHQAVIEKMVDAHITIDNRGIIRSFNQAAEQIFGFLPEEAIGKNVKILMPEPDHSQHDEYLDHYKKTGERKILRATREVTAVRKNGEKFPIELTVVEMIFEDGKYYSGIIRDITERKKIEVMKTEFISTVSHELRTPITSIRGSLGLITGGAVGEIPEQMKLLLEIATNNTERLLLLINDILDIQKIEAGKMSFKFRKINLNQFLDKAVQDNSAYGNQYGVNFLISRRADENTFIYADDDRLMQVLSNLLSNAAKFSNRGDSVFISSAIHENFVRISVTDTGDGIPEEFYSKIFEKFTQSDSSETRQTGGSGLGLSITKAIVEQHGGEIHFISKINQGSTFYFDLPRIEAMQNDEKPGRVPPHNPCILIVEDDPDIAVLIQRMLAEGGFNSDIAHTAGEAKILLKEKGDQYLAISLDLILPDQNGMDFLQEIRQMEDFKGIPVVIASVKADESKLKFSGHSMGIVDWLQKPFDKKRLVDAVRSIYRGNVLPNILHVEDDPDIAHIVRLMLQDEAKVISVSTLRDAKEVLKKEDIDMVMLDINLPDGSGLSLIDEIKMHPKKPRILIFSAQEVSSEVARTVDAALVKTATSDRDLIDSIKSMIE